MSYSWHLPNHMSFHSRPSTCAKKGYSRVCFKDKLLEMKVVVYIQVSEIIF